jgi:hypothetical protein
VGFMNARRLILSVIASLSALAGGTLLAAPAALGEEQCPNAASRQGPSAALPDCRAYEQVTPTDKGDAQDLFPSNGLERLAAATENTGYPAADGEHFLFVAESSFTGGDAVHSSYVFSRTPQGWTTKSLSPGPGVHFTMAKLFNPADLSEVGVEDHRFSNLPGQHEEQARYDYTGAPGGPYTTLGVVPYGGGNEASETMVGASTDLSHVVLQSVDHELAPGGAGQDEGSFALYEAFAGQLRLVNVASDGSLLNPCGAELGLGESTLHTGTTHDAVSNDGSKIFFTAPDPVPFQVSGSKAGCWNPGTTPQENPPQLYMRLDGTSTVEVSAPDPGVSDPAGPQPAVYVGASADGSKVFFMTTGELTPDDTTHAPELYEYDTEAPEGKRLKRISGGESGSAEGDVDFVGAVSSDGSTVYFTAFGKLASGASAIEEQKFGLVNLYRYDTITGKTTYMTRVDADEYPLAPGQSGSWYMRSFPGAHAENVALASNADWYTTANGQYLAFGSIMPLTGYDNSSQCQNLFQGSEFGNFDGKCAELYRYNAADNSIICVSCAGGPPVDNARFNRSPFEVPSSAPPRPISEDGSYVFFETLNALVPNTGQEKLHVYEWHDGRISLISSPQDPSNAYFLGASADGANVFFGTHAQLVPGDTDVGGDLYDARIDGGFTGLTPALCTGTGCQGVPGAPPIFATPASTTFEGVGNFPPSAASVALPRGKGLTQAQQLAKALKACRRDRSRSKRRQCEALARKRAGGAHKSDKSKRRGKR